MYKVYVAGAISDTNPVKVLHNLGRGIAMGKKLLLHGFAPFVPHLDLLMHLMMYDDPLTDVKLWYEYSLEWLIASDIVLVLPNSKHSKGTQQEIAKANEIGIPIFHSIKELKEYEIRYGKGSEC